MSFHPIKSSENIVDYFRNYLLTTYRTSDPIYNKQLQEKIDRNRLAKGPFITLSDPYKQAKTLSQLADEGIVAKSITRLSSLHPQRPLYSHQEEAIRKAANDQNLIITTGTGSGKTESFIIPIVNHLLKQREAGTLGAGVQALLIYPMNALVNDQIRRLRELFTNTDIDDIYFAKFTGETKDSYGEALTKYKQLNDGQDPMINELISRKQIREKKPHILITNYAMLEYLLLRPDDNVIFANDNADTWKFIVFDEAHSYNGAKGIEVSNLIKRVKATLNRQDIQFLLTSATLGNDDEKIANFGKLLCSSHFSADGIIRSETVRPEPSSIHVPISWEKYRELAERLSDSRHTISQNEAIEIYDRVLHDAFLAKVREVLLGKTLEVKEVIERLGVSEEAFLDFITVATHGQKDGMRIFEARYHMFIRGIDGAYVTIAPDDEKKLFVDKMTTYEDENGETVPCYEITFCNQCHANFITGVIEEGRLVQKRRNREDKNLKVFLLHESDLSDDNEVDEESAYLLCGRCSKLHQANSLSVLCKHDEKYHQRIMMLESESKCPCCQSQNKSRSITRPYMLGVDSATAVLATALYKEMPEQNKGKRFLSFSDSRQAAAYFSSYLQDTYDDNLRRRLLAICCDEFNETLLDGMKLTTFQEKLNEKFQLYFDNTKQDVANCICRELCQTRSGNSLLVNGYIYLDLDFSQMQRLPEIPSLGDEQVKLLIRILVYASFIQSRSLQIGDPLQEGYSTYFTDYSGVIPDSWQGKGSSTGRKLENIMKYFFNRLMTENYSTEIGNGYAKQIWKFLEDARVIKKNSEKKRGNKDKYYLTGHNLLVKRVKHLYQCPRCRHYYIHHMEKLCHNPRCVEKGVSYLEMVDFDQKDDFHHYKTLLTDFSPEELRVEEHTAQIDKDEAYQLQHDFEKGDINVLSCSTTFEMGIDVGTLDTIFMRNMPPTPANYAQRAGRAGRSLQSIAYAITYSSNGSHDTHYFKDPTKMIKGDILPPNFDVANEKIIQRHIFASAFAFFWKTHPAYYNDNKLLGDFFRNKIHEKLITYLNEHPKELENFLTQIIDEKLGNEVFGISEFKWLERLYSSDKSQNGVLNAACTQFLNDVYSLKELRKQFSDEIENSNLSAKEEKKRETERTKIGKTITTINSGKILEFLSRNNLIPKYSFPVDTVELTVASNIPKEKESPKYNLQRDLFIAISEYAPDSEIVVGKKLLTSRYIKRAAGLEWLKYSFFKCKECSCLNIALKGVKLERTCKNCGELNSQKYPLEDFIIPRLGFIAENEITDVGLNKPERSYHGEISYIGSSDKSSSPIVEREKASPPYFEIEGHSIEVITKSHDELAVLNTSCFMVCETCGYAEKVEALAFTRGQKMTKVKHIDSRGYPCSGLLTPLRLGHTFKTDVACISFKDISINHHDQAWSILYCLIEGLCHYLHITRTEISGCLKQLEDRNYQFIIFDQTPGGAGYVKQLKQHECFEGMLAQALKMIASCECGGNAQDTACYSCLCNYYNQAHHDILKRRYALDFFDNFLDRKQRDANLCIVKCMKDTGTDLCSSNDEDIWENISDELEPTILDSLVALCEQYSPLHKPFFNADLSIYELNVNKTPRRLNTAFIWERTRCALFYSQDDCQDSDQQALESADWKCFFLGSNFDPAALIAAISQTTPKD